jgi:AcrR family transcriptional regulator
MVILSYLRGGEMAVDRKKKILEVAAKSFSLFGYKATTMDQVARLANVGKGTIYLFFKNKEELFLASIAETMAAEFRKIYDSSFTSGDLMTGADRFFDQLLAFDRKYAALRRDMDGILSRNPSLMDGAAGLHSEGLGLMQQFFKEHKKNGTIRTTIDSMDLVLLCSTLAHGLTGNVNSGMDPAEAKRLWLLGFAQIVNVDQGKKKK